MSSSLEDGQESTLAVSRARITARLSRDVQRLVRQQVFGPSRPASSVFRSSSSSRKEFESLSIDREVRDGNSTALGVFNRCQRPIASVGENEEAELARGHRSRFCIPAGTRTCSCIRSESGATPDHPPRRDSRHFSPAILFSRRPSHLPPVFLFFFLSLLTPVFYNTQYLHRRVTPPLSPPTFSFPFPTILYFPSRITIVIREF